MFITDPIVAPSRPKFRRAALLATSALLSAAALPAAAARPDPAPRVGQVSANASAEVSVEPADVAAADAGADAEGGTIVVTARNKDEKLLDVPIPISVLDGEKIAQQRVFNISDLTQRAPGLTATTPNARRTGVPACRCAASARPAATTIWRPRSESSSTTCSSTMSA